LKILEGKKRAFFIGIGGIGMSALARYLINKGIEIYGYDRTETVLTKKLEDEGMKIHYVDNVELITENIDLVVYTPAIPDEHKEKNWFIKNDFQLFKRSELLREILRESRVIAVAGTHGKTSTSSVMAHLLRGSDISTTCFVGGIMVNYGTNFLYGDSEWVIIEADEYDRSFLRLYPDIAIIQALDPDHLDIYGTGEEMIESYRQFSRQIKDDGILVIPHHVDEKMSMEWKKELWDRNVDVITYGDDQAEFKLESIESDGLKTDVTIETRDGNVNLSIPFPGKHNALNAIGASIVANHQGMSWQRINEQIKSFKGIKRRFELIHESSKGIFIDDYAHHPEEIKAMVNGLKSSYPGKKIVGVFQPHLFTRTRDFVDGFANELDKFDEVILLPIYPAREIPIQGVTTRIILAKMKNENKELIEKAQLIDKLKEIEIEVLVTLGAGDIDKLVPLIKKEIFEG